MSDSLIDGRPFRVLNVIDDYNREALLNCGSISFPTQRVVRHLEELLEYYGKPKYIRTDNGPEFISKEYKEWCEKEESSECMQSLGNPCKMVM